MNVTTVTGPVDADDLGITLPHEHLFIDVRNQFTDFDDPEKRRLSREPVRMDNLGVVRSNPYAIKDNLVIDDVELTIREVEAFKNNGGQTIVDCTSNGLARDVRKLRDVAQRSGVNIVAGCGYYTHDTHPSEMEMWSADYIADMMLRDITEGIDGTGIKAGIIGEIGTSSPVRPNERKNLIAAALAFQEIGLGIQVHTYPWGKEGLEAVDILTENGVDPAKIVICHTDVEIESAYMRELLKKGVFIEFDNFGKEFYIPVEDRGFAGRVFARDIDRVKVIKELVDEGYEKQLLITNDLCLKSMLLHYGGRGYSHILLGVRSMMCEIGISEEVMHQFLCENPRRLLAV